MTFPLAEFLRPATCPACGHHLAAAFFDGGEQPLATIAWPASAAEAQALPKLPLDFVRCLDCGHVYNTAFDYAHVPYSDKPNLMFNRAAIWGEHLMSVRDMILANLPDAPVVVEIGCGEGHLLRALAQTRPAGRYIGFDPNGSIDTTEGLAQGQVEAKQELFDPAIHLAECRPHLIISRHVLEHLMNPLSFIQQIAFAADWLKLKTHLFIETPCIDKVFASGRIADFYYEHNSHFTTASFTRLLQRAACKIESLQHGYNGEVIYALAQIGTDASERTSATQFAEQAIRFRAGAKQAKATIAAQLAELNASGKIVAIWGGTGKAAAFINYFGADAKRFAVVVDSDADKAGTFVPGAGQKIHYRDYLLDHPAEVILIPTQWRAKDIVGEMVRSGITPQTVLIEHQGRLVNYHTDTHPYL